MRVSDVTHQSVEMVSIFLMFQSYWHSHLSKLKSLVPSLKYVPSLDCDSCQVSLHLRASFPVSQSSRSFKLFDVIHSDVWRNVPNHSRFKYYVIFIDGFSRMSWLFLLHDRTEMITVFKGFLDEIQTQFSAISRVFRSDNACEYKSNQLTSLVNIMGIIHETSCPHTPQPNNIAERKHRHLLEVITCLLSSMNVPQLYWPETLMTTCYLINRMPNFVLGNKIPFFILFPVSLPPRLFGCVCFIRNCFNLLKTSFPLDQYVASSWDILIIYRE